MKLSEVSQHSPKSCAGDAGVAVLGNAAFKGCKPEGLIEVDAAKRCVEMLFGMAEVIMQGLGQWQQRSSR